MTNKDRLKNEIDRMPDELVEKVYAYLTSVKIKKKKDPEKRIRAFKLNGAFDQKNAKELLTPIELFLDKMTLADKLETMEALWADISRKPDALPSPAWHRQVLEERRRLEEQGKLRFLDWDVAIAELREEVLENTPSSHGVTHGVKSALGS